MRNWAVLVAVVAWVIVLLLLILATTLGTAATRVWLNTYGALLSAAILAAITTVYVILTHQHLRITHLMCRFQFGAGTRVEILQQERVAPPEFRILDAYAYPEEYVRRALPRRAKEAQAATEVRASTTYEIVRVYNDADHPIYRLRLQLLLHYTGCRKKRFEYTHQEPIFGKGFVDIGVWPIDNMPEYQLAVSGDYRDAVGTFPLSRQEVSR